MLFCLVLISFVTYIKCGEVCYGDLGCFSLAYPWTSLLRPFPRPQAPEEINTRLYCYTRDSIELRYNVTLRPKISLGGCPFVSNRPTVFITHGFFNTGSISWLNEMKNAYLNAIDDNVFIVDWGKEAVMINYFQASSSTRVVAAEVLRFIKHLTSEYGLKASSLHLIGHSLGAQIMSYVGKDLPGTQRITGLDPAKPGFEDSDMIVRLDKSDATFVEIIHTNGIPLVGLGYTAPHGHLDFYMNGGLRQPLCEASDIKTEVKNFNDLKDFTINVAQSTLACSHNRVYKYFIDAIRPNCTLWGRKASKTTRLLEALTSGLYDSLVPVNKACDADSCIPVGLETPKYKARGVFIVNTPNEAPFCEDPAENEKILLEMSGSSNSNKTSKTEGVVGKTISVGSQAIKAVKKASTGLTSTMKGLFFK